MVRFNVGIVVIVGAELNNWYQVEWGSSRLEIGPKSEGPAKRDMVMAVSANMANGAAMMSCATMATTIMMGNSARAMGQKWVTRKLAPGAIRAPKRTDSDVARSAPVG